MNVNLPLRGHQVQNKEHPIELCHTHPTYSPNIDLQIANM